MYRHVANKKKNGNKKMYLQKRLIMTLCLNSWGNIEDTECIPLL